MGSAMTDTSSYQENQEIDAQQYVSINVPNAPNVHYFRVGTADTTTENNLPADPNDPTGDTNAQAGNTISDGIALYTTGSYSLSAPISNSWSSDSLTAVTDGNGSLYTATYTTGAAHGMRPATVTFQNVDQMTNTAAASVNFLNGDALTYWNGNDQSLGIGGLLWANYGFTTNLFGGSIINLTNDSAEVQGFGSFKVTDTNTISAAGAIVLSVSPVEALADINALVTKYTAVMAVLTLVTTGMTAAMTGELKKSGLDEASLKTTMNNLYDQQIAATSLVTFIQALSLLLAIRLQAEQFAAAEGTSVVTITDAGILLRCGETLLDVSELGITMTVGDTVVSANGLSFDVEAGAGITLASDETAVEVSAAGLTVTAPLVEFLPG
jgi:hypothetical protein